MIYRFALQDPTARETAYLYEEIVAQLQNPATASWRALFAFASVGGVRPFTEDPAVHDYLTRGGSWTLVVGLDAITDRATLQKLLELSNEFPAVSASVFQNPSASLFHPKVSHFTRDDGLQVVIAGSGNLTQGGLRTNIEAFSVAEFPAGLPPDLRQWDYFLDHHASEIGPIDDAAFARADLNHRAAAAARRQVRPPAAAAPTPRGLAADEAMLSAEDLEPWAPLPEQFQPTDRVLIARIPKAGPRWHQVHLNRDIVARFFRVEPESAQRAFLHEAKPSGELGDEEVRKCLRSRINLNPRIEFGAKAGVPYPDNGPPILVAHEIGLRNFLYTILLPEDRPYAAVTQLLLSQPSIGRGTRRAIFTRADLLNAWPECYV